MQLKRHKKVREERLGKEREEKIDEGKDGEKGEDTLLI